MDEAKKHFKQKSQLSQHSVKKEDLSSPASQNLSLTLPKLNMSSLSFAKNSPQFPTDSRLNGSFFMKKEFPAKPYHKLTKTEQSHAFSKTNSIWNETNFQRFITLSTEKREAGFPFRRLEALKKENTLKGIEKYTKLNKFIRIMANFYNKLPGKVSEIDVDVSSCLNEFEENLMAFFREICLGIESLVKESSEKNEKIESLNKNLNELKANFSSQISEHVKKINDSAEAQFKKIYQKSSLNDLYNSFESQKLEKEVEVLRAALMTFEKTHNVEELVEKLNRLRENSDRKFQEMSYSIQKKDALIFQISAQLNAFKGTNQKLEKDLSHQIETSSSLENEVSKLKSEILQLKSRLSCFREIALMQKEDFETIFGENQRNLKYISSLEKKLKEIKKKMGYNMELLNNLREDEFENDNNLLKQVASFMSLHFSKQMKRLERDSIGKSTREEELEQNEENFLARYQYYKPSFYTLIRREAANRNKNDPVAVLNSMKKNTDFKISPMFLATIRAIMDSKYNEFLLYEDHRQITKFPDFTYSWLSTFFVSSASRTMKFLDLDKIADVETLREEFLLTLANPLVLKLWECLNFKEFLEEKASIDELYFYLHCRFLLNKGPQMESDGATFNYVCYVRNDYAQTVVDLLMKNFDEQSKLFLKQKLGEKARFKNKHLLIDSAFVLRILLEYYRLERKQRLKLIKNLFILLPPDQKLKKKLAVSTFKAFRVLLEKTSFSCTELDKAELFRECYQVGNGEITPEVFFTVLTETNFFVSTLKLRSFLNMPLTPSLINQEDYLSVTEFFVKKFQGKNLKPLLKEMQAMIEEAGNEKLWAFWEKNLKVFSENYRFIDFETLCGKIPDFNFLSIMKLFIMVKSLRNFNLHLKSENYSEFNDAVMDWEVYENLVSLVKKHTSANKIKEFEKNKRVRRLQDFFKRRITKWYVLINKLLKSKKK